MVLIDRTQKGRILVRDFEIEKIVYLFLKEFYPQFKCYSVDYTDSILNIYVRNVSDVDFDQLDRCQAEAQNYFQEKMGIYFKLINLNIK